MWEQFGATAIYSAIGGGFGVLIGGLLALPFRNSKIGSMMATVLTVAGAIIGVSVAEPLLKPYIGQYLPTPPAAKDPVDAQIDATFKELETLPTFAAILKREPDLNDSLEAKFRDVAANAGSTDEARQMAFSAAYDEVAVRFLVYLKRSRVEDLVAYFSETNDDLIYLSASDPQFCFESMYDAGALAALELDEMKAKYGIERFNRQQELAARVIENAYDEIPAYDTDVGAAALGRASGVLLAELGLENIGMVSEITVAMTPEDFKLVCDASIAMNNSLLGEADAAAAIRYIFTQAG